MKRHTMIAAFFLVVLVAGFASAQRSGQGNGGVGTGDQDGLYTQDQDQDQIRDQIMDRDRDALQTQQRDRDQDQDGLLAQERDRDQQMDTARALERLQKQLREREQAMNQEMNQEMVHLSVQQQEQVRNQNQVRLAVHALGELENFTGAFGPQIRDIARHFNNSVQVTVRAEEHIQTRGGVMRFFAGGDLDAAEEIEAQTARNQERIRELWQIVDDCDCDEQTRTMLRDQIHQMENEQMRLEGLAQQERERTGLFGWIWR